MSSKSIPRWVEAIDGQSFVQVLKPSTRNENVIIGARQFVKVVAVTESGLNTMRSVKSSSAGITAASFHPIADSVMVAAGSNGEVSVFYFGAQNLAALNDKWTAHSRAIHGAEFLPIPKGKQRLPLPGHLDRDSAMLLTVSADGEMNCWDVCAYSGKKETWRKPILVGNMRGEGLKSGLRDLDVMLKHDKYEVIVACEDGAVELYVSLNMNPITLTLRRRLSVSTQTVNSVRFRPGSTRRFATGGKDGYVRIFDFDNIGDHEMKAYCAIRSQSPVWAVRWRPAVEGEGDFVSSCQSVMDSCIYVWDLESRLMPAYVINAHRENVTDFFWADRNHIISCSRDNTVQMHAIKDAVIPVEKMRTVNIAVALDRRGNQTLTSVCDVVNRDRFERVHEDLRIEDIKNFGFPAPSAQDMHIVNAPAQIFCVPAMRERWLKINPIPVGKGNSLCPLEICAAAQPLCVFIQQVSSLALGSEVADACTVFSKRLKGGQSETIRLLGWILRLPCDSKIFPVLNEFISKGLSTYQELNDVVMVLALGSVANFSNLQTLNSLVSVPQLVKWSKSLLEILRRSGKWQLAAEYVCFSPFSDVRSLSHSRTSMQCSSHKECMNCSLCGDSVEGQWVVCQGCGHGGHPRHVDWWFQHHNFCPVPDCAHACIS